MPYSVPSLKRMAVAKAIAHPTDDLVKVSAQVRNMTDRNNFLWPEPDPKDGKGAMLYRPGDCVIAAVVLRLWAAGFAKAETAFSTEGYDVFDAAVLRLSHWYLTDENPDWKPGDPDPDDAKDAPHPDRPFSPACFVLRDFCETRANWSLRIDIRRHAITGAVRRVASLWREDSALGNGSPLFDGESPQSTHVIVLTEILAQIAAHTIFKGGAHGTH